MHVGVRTSPLMVRLKLYAVFRPTLAMAPTRRGNHDYIDSVRVGATNSSVATSVSYVGVTKTSMP